MLIHELTELEDARAREALAIYEASFPVQDRYPRELLRTFTSHPRPDATDRRAHFWACVDGGAVVAIAVFAYTASTRLGYLAYFATRADLRGSGVGSVLFPRIVEQIALDAMATGDHGALGLCFEVEDPDVAPTPEEQRLCRKRIEFYRRNGAVLIERFRYDAPPVIPGAPSPTFRLMVAPIDRRWDIDAFSSLRAMLETIMVRNLGVPAGSPFLLRAVAAAATRAWIRAGGPTAVPIAGGFGRRPHAFAGSHA